MSAVAHSLPTFTRQTTMVLMTRVIFFINLCWSIKNVLAKGILKIKSTLCAKDCCTRKSTCVCDCAYAYKGHAWGHAAGIHTNLSKIVPYFWIYTCEELIQAANLANKIIKSICWLWRPQTVAHTVDVFPKKYPIIFGQANINLKEGKIFQYYKSVFPSKPH